ncbi:uncharacterized protein LOC116160431 [Photinus pyralis]|nr:uncharacterized protein LOC116160431 [Photinus pyralis]
MGKHKRKNEEDFKQLKKRLKILEGQVKKRKRVLVMASDSSDQEDSVHDHGENFHTELISNDQENVDPQLLSLLGEKSCTISDVGEAIHPELVQRWEDLIKSGLNEE